MPPLARALVPLLVAGALVAGCGNSDEPAGTTNGPATAATSQTADGAAAPASTASAPAPNSTAAPAASDPPAPASSASTEPAVAGKAVFASAGCVGCHTLADAGATGTAGPDLDQLRPDEARVAAQVRSGGGGMPSFAGRLSDGEIQAVAAYVASATGVTGATTAAPPAGGGTGKEIFKSAGCATCHTLADAGASGAVGPNLDDESPDAEKVAKKVAEGGDGMPSFTGVLSAAEIQKVADYVASVTGGGRGDRGGGGGDGNGGGDGHGGGDNGGGGDGGGDGGD
jgi:mono/diheme cytochrome c family protein